MAARDAEDLDMKARPDALFDCTGDSCSCAPCGARYILRHGRDDRMMPLVDALEETMNGMTFTAADLALFLSRATELVIRNAGPHGVAIARGALLLAEANAKALAQAGRAGRRLDG